MPRGANQQTSEKRAASARENATLSRPGRKKLTSLEARERSQALRIYRRLNLKLAKIAEARVNETLDAINKLRRGNGSLPDGERRRLREIQLTNMDLERLMAEINDRFGFPKASPLDQLLGDDSKPPVLVGIALDWPGMGGNGAVVGVGGGGERPGGSDSSNR